MIRQGVNIMGKVYSNEELEKIFSNFVKRKPGRKPGQPVIKGITKKGKNG